METVDQSAHQVTGFGTLEIMKDFANQARVALRSSCSQNFTTKVLDQDGGFSSLAAWTLRDHEKSNIRNRINHQRLDRVRLKFKVHRPVGKETLSA